MRYLVMYHKGESLFSSGYKQFGNTDELNKFIELKAKNGFTCHRFEYKDSFRPVQTVDNFVKI